MLYSTECASMPRSYQQNTKRPERVVMLRLRVLPQRFRPLSRA